MRAQIQSNVSIEIGNKLATIARKKGWTISYLVKIAVEEYIKRELEA